MVYLLLLVSFLSFILGVYYFFAGLTEQWGNGSIKDPRLNILIQQRYIRLWTKVYVGCFVVSGMALLFAVQLHRGV